MIEGAGSAAAVAACTALIRVLADLPRTGSFAVRTIDDAARQITAATWPATQSGRTELTGATSSKIDDIVRVEIVTDAGVTVLENS